VTETTVSISVNGEERRVPAGIALPSLLEELGVDRRLIAVAHNGEVVPRDRHPEVVVHEGDAIEIVRMVGGG
jgi:thiazole synthase